MELRAHSRRLQANSSGPRTISLRFSRSWSRRPDAVLVQQGGPPTVDVNENPTHPTTPAILTHYEVYDAPEQQTDSLSLGSLKMDYRHVGRAG